MTEVHRNSLFFSYPFSPSNVKTQRIKGKKYIKSEVLIINVTVITAIYYMVCNASLPKFFAH